MCAFYDASDILSDVWKSLAAKCDRFDFETFDELMKFLQHSAEQKLIDEFRRQHTLKRDRRREQPLTIHGDEGDAGVLASTDPSPSEVAQAHETHEQLLANLKPDERLAVELRLDKYDTDVIAERTGWHKRKVQRFFKDLCDSWQLWGGSRG
jgi:RNA polymerase sigma factor (sigma-70 family)